MRKLVGIVAALVASAHAAMAAPAHPETAPPPPAPIPVDETLYGTHVRDPYRGMERLDPATVDWIRAQGAYARSVLDAIAPRAGLQRRLAALEARFAAVDSYQSAGGRSFYRERAPGADDFNLVVRDRSGVRTLVDVAAIRAADNGVPAAISYFLASPDGSEVAVGISERGSEDAALWVYDARTGARIAGPVDRAQFGLQSWAFREARLDAGARLAAALTGAYIRSRHPEPSPKAPSMSQFVCPSCGAGNRIAEGRDARQAKCGKCHQPVLTGAPLEVSGAELAAHRAGTKGAALLLDVWAPWCGPCKSMAPQFAAAAKTLEPEARLLKLNSDAEPAAASALGVSGIPALFLIRDGRVIAQTAGAMPASQIVAWTRQALAQAA